MKFFEAMKRFFNNLFKKELLLKEINQSIDSYEDDFMQSIKVKGDKEKTKLLKLQEEFSKGNIEEEDISKEDVEKLYKLYDGQIEELNRSIENYKQETLKIMSEIKKRNNTV